MNKEIWKDIPNIKNYQASDYGRIRNKETGYILKPIIEDKGYLIYSINRKLYRGHRLIAKTFIPNPNNKPEVNHIDENKTNNKASNLMWCTHIENSNWGTRNKRISKTQEKPIYQYDLKGNFVKEWGSAKEAEEKLNIHHVGCCCLGKRKTAGKYVWRFKEGI